MLLGKKDNTNEKENLLTDALANLANLVGTPCQASHFNKVHWIIDSGAMDHIRNTIKISKIFKEITTTVLPHQMVISCVLRKLECALKGLVL